MTIGDRIVGHTERDIFSILWVVLAVFVESVQVLIICALLSNHFPPQADAFAAQNFTKVAATLKPDRQILLYRVFVMTNVVLAAFFLRFFHHKIKDPQWMGRLRAYAIVQMIIVALQVFACFKIIVYQSPPWAWTMLFLSLAVGGVVRLFWPELCKALEYIDARWLGRDVTGPPRWVDVAVVLVIAGCIYTPQLTMFKDIMGVAILYFCVCYFVLRGWLKNALLAAAGVLLAMKLHLFNAGVAPLVWMYPAKTFLRYLWDVAALWSIVRHAQSCDRRYLWLAGACVGAALIHALDTGLVLLAAFYLYLVLYRTWAPGPHIRMKMFFVAPVAAAGLLWFAHGRPMPIFFAWPPALPFHDCLKGLQFFAFVMAFVIPLVYVATILIVGTLCGLKRIGWHNSVAVVISAYGLGLYPYFVRHSALDNYYSVGIPFVLVLCFWFQCGLSLANKRVRRLVSMSAVLLALLALLTNPLFMYYHSVVVSRT